MAQDDVVMGDGKEEVDNVFVEVDSESALEIVKMVNELIQNNNFLLITIGVLFNRRRKWLS